MCSIRIPESMRCFLLQRWEDFPCCSDFCGLPLVILTCSLKFIALERGKDIRPEEPLGCIFSQGPFFLRCFSSALIGVFQCRTSDLSQGCPRALVPVVVQHHANRDTKRLNNYCFDVPFFFFLILRITKHALGLVTLLGRVQISLSQFLIKAACRVWSWAALQTGNCCRGVLLTERMLLYLSGAATQNGGKGS